MCWQHQDLSGLQKPAGHMFSKSRAAHTLTVASVTYVACCAAGAKDPDNLGLNNFPYISTANPNYSPELTKLLSQQANWQVEQLAPQLQQLLKGTGITVTQAA